MVERSESSMSHEAVIDPSNESGQRGLEPANVRLERVQHAAGTGPSSLGASTLPTTPTRQFAGLIVAPVIPDKLDELRQLLDRIHRQTIEVMQGRASEGPGIILPFHALESVHYARFVLLE